MTLLSIVTPSYNQGKFLRATVESVLSQAGVDLEYVVVDGGSQDNSLEILKEYGSRFKWVSEPDKGQADAINKGFWMSHGSILGWLNSDDLYSPGALSRVIEEFDTDPNVMMVYGKGQHIDTEGNLLDEHPSGEFNLEALSYGCFICQPACFFRRSLWDAVGGLDAGIHYALDLDLWIRCGRLQLQTANWQFRFVNESFAFSRMHIDNKTLSMRCKVYSEIIGTVRKHFRYVPFNWIYDAEEVASGSFDGYFKRSPFRLSLLTRSLMKWVLINRSNPAYVMRKMIDVTASPQRSFHRFQRRINTAL